MALAAQQPDFEIDLAKLPPGVADMLRPFDEDGSGKLAAGELREAVARFQAAKASRAGGGAFKLDAFPADVRKALEAFDDDGSGEISADEIGQAARLLQQSKEQQAKLRRILYGLGIAGVVFFAITFAVMVASSYVTVKATQTLAASSGALTTKDGSVARTAGGSLGLVTQTDIQTAANPQGTASQRALFIALTQLGVHAEAGHYFHSRAPAMSMVGVQPPAAVPEHELPFVHRARRQLIETRLAGRRLALAKDVHPDSEEAAAFRRLTTALTTPAADAGYIVQGAVSVDVMSSICSLFHEGQQTASLTLQNGEDLLAGSIDLPRASLRGCVGGSLLNSTLLPSVDVPVPQAVAEAAFTLAGDDTSYLIQCFDTLGEDSQCSLSRRAVVGSGAGLPVDLEADAADRRKAQAVLGVLDGAAAAGLSSEAAMPYILRVLANPAAFTVTGALTADAGVHVEEVPVAGARRLDFSSYTPELSGANSATPSKVGDGPNFLGVASTAPITQFFTSKSTAGNADIINTTGMLACVARVEDALTKGTFKVNGLTAGYAADLTANQATLDKTRPHVEAALHACLCAHVASCALGIDAFHNSGNYMNSAGVLADPMRVGQTGILFRGDNMASAFKSFREGVRAGLKAVAAAKPLPAQTTYGWGWLFTKSVWELLGERVEGQGNPGACPYWESEFLAARATKRAGGSWPAACAAAYPGLDFENWYFPSYDWWRYSTLEADRLDMVARQASLWTQKPAGSAAMYAGVVANVLDQPGEADDYVVRNFGQYCAAGSSLYEVAFEEVVLAPFQVFNDANWNTTSYLTGNAAVDFPKLANCMNKEEMVHVFMVFKRYLANQAAVKAAYDLKDMKPATKASPSPMPSMLSADVIATQSDSTYLSSKSLGYMTAWYSTYNLDLAKLRSYLSAGTTTAFLNDFKCHSPRRFKAVKCKTGGLLAAAPSAYMTPSASPSGFRTASPTPSQTPTRSKICRCSDY